MALANIIQLVKNMILRSGNTTVLHYVPGVDQASLEPIREAADALTKNPEEDPKLQFAKLIPLLLRTESILISEPAHLPAKTRKEALETQKNLQARFVEYHNLAFPEDKPIQVEDLAIPGSDEWHRLYTFSRLATDQHVSERPGFEVESSDVNTVEQSEATSEVDIVEQWEAISSEALLSEEDKEDKRCLSCRKKISESDNVSQLPCSPNHRLHFSCLAKLAQTKELEFSCPACHGSLLKDNYLF